MNVLTEEFQGKTLRYAIVSDDGILFNTRDVCRILRILRRPPAGVLSHSCLNTAGVIEAAFAGGKNNLPFVDWIEKKFIGYDIQTPISLNCDSDWKLKSADRSTSKR